ncbi:MAG: peptidylprolyl isomerase [Deltaproteobacteria bacterium]|nr:peptidylprolyl isomerase [Deltaproteobacteria bacterium]MBW2397208.1 peptidylprolyl isomerase [Deltaproteobacteria bacterium]
MAAGSTRWLVIFAALVWASACQVGNVPTTKGNPVVILTTSKGTIEIELDTENAPISSENFLAYVDSGHFDGTIFHRVIPGFMVQGGGFTADMNQKSTQASIENEATNGIKNERGTLSMARTSDVNSATSQFFINVADNKFLDHTSPDPRGYGYAVFAKVTSGMDVVDAIVAVPTGNHGGHGDVPNEAITIDSAKRK